MPEPGPLAATTFAVILAAAAGASGEPVYLDCLFPPESPDAKTYQFSVKLDEESGKVTHTRSTGDAFNTEGFFAANSVSYQRIGRPGGTKFTELYEINRTSLAITQTITVVFTEDPRLAPQFPPNVTVRQGSCGLIEAKERRF